MFAKLLFTGTNLLMCMLIMLWTEFGHLLSYMRLPLLETFAQQAMIS